MSSNNNNDTGVIVGFIVAGLAMIAFFIFALFAFAAFVLTILAIFAWNKPLRIGRKFVITPEEARAFVGRGIVGMWLVPAFALFVNVFLGVHINWEYFTHMMIVGYVGGSIGIEVMMAEESGGGGYVEPHHHQQVLPPAPAQKALPPAERDPFRYATWDDEEENRR